MESLGKSRGHIPRGLRPLGFWPWDFPWHSIHHSTPSAFPNNVPFLLVTSACIGNQILQKFYPHKNSLSLLESATVVIADIVHWVQYWWWCLVVLMVVVRAVVVVRTVLMVVILKTNITAKDNQFRQKINYFPPLEPFN